MKTSWDWADWVVAIVIAIGLIGIAALVVGLFLYASERDRTFVDRCATTGMTNEQCLWIKENTRQ